MASTPPQSDTIQTPAQSTNPIDDSDLDPAAFLKSVRELSEKREREDAERFRKLEEEVERGRQERAARRLERAKSISPQKRQTSSTSSHPLSRIGISTPPRMSPSNETTATPPTDGLRHTSDSDGGKSVTAEEVPDFKGFGSMKRSSAASTPASQRTTDTSQSPSQPSATSLARSGTLSWQQRRPNPRVGGGRPVSMVEPSKLASTTDTELTRDQISAQLGARDPSWFRQTQDRGAGSAAYRKSKDEVNPSDSVSVTSSRRGLHGMSRESSIEPNEGHYNSETPSRVGSVRESVVSSGSRFSTASGPSNGKPDLKSLIEADADQQRASPAHERAADDESSVVSRASTMSSSQARLSSKMDRSPSPTKGMGGFVQSALLKRSDSISKRGNSQSVANSARPDSISSLRGGQSSLQGSLSMPKLNPTNSTIQNLIDETTTKQTSTSVGDLTTLPSETEKDPFVKPSLPYHSRSKSIISVHANEDSQLPQPPGSPSKRWSPNKSSWIESALQRPESPTKSAPTKNAQPSWMADLAKAKAQRASVDLGREPVEAHPSQPSSPTKPVPFGQGMLKRSSTRDLTEKPSPKPAEPPTSAAKPTSTSTTADTSALPPAELQPASISTTSPTQMKVEDSDPDKQLTTQEAQLPKPQTIEVAPGQGPSRPPVEAATSKAKPEVAPKSKLLQESEAAAKPNTSFRSNLRPRAPTQSMPKPEPEFLSKVGSLRKTQQEKFVAPDLLKDNILRGKAGLNLTDGPVKSERKDEFRESINAKKVEMKTAKAEGRELPGQVHERKTSETRQPPAKPEALARRDILQRTESSKAAPMSVKQDIPEALVRHKSLKQKPLLDKTDQAASQPAPAAAFERLEKQISAPGAVESSKLASRFNPGLAGLLARGPPAASNASSRTGSPVLARTVSGEPPADESTLQDMRKDRAKGPKRRKGAGSAKSSSVPEREQVVAPEATPMAQTSLSNSKSAAATKLSGVSTASSQNRAPQDDKAAYQSVQEVDASVPTPKAKPRALPGSAASLMMASLKKPDHNGLPQVEQVDSAPLPTPSLIISPKPSIVASSVQSAAAADRGSPVPEFKGFGSSRTSAGARQKPDENKENATDATLPSVRSAASMWGRRPSPKKNETPAQIQLPSKKDEESAMKSAALLATPSPVSLEKTRNVNSINQASTGLPPKPTKSSRVVSGQLTEASPNKDALSTFADSEPDTDVGKMIFKAFGAIPKSSAALAIDTQAVITTCGQQQRGEDIRTIRKEVQFVSPNGTMESMPPQEEYTLYDESVYLCTHHLTTANGIKITRVFVWAGSLAPDTNIETATASARRVARENGGAPSHTVRQGQESSALLQALGGILVTRRGSRVNASKQYMLCGRKHLSHIVFDEVKFSPESLCSGFVYLISFPITLQETKLYLWKGSACSAEELSAARLAATDLSETGEIIEVDDGAEFPSFLKIFGPHTTKSSLSPSSTSWTQKSLAANKFSTRLLRIQASESRPSLMSSLWNRRPTWSNLSNSMSTSPSSSKVNSPSHTGEDQVRIEAKLLPIFSQSSLEAEGIYILDAYFRIYVLLGPLLPKLRPEDDTRKATARLLTQALLFASDYVILATSMEDRPGIPKCEVVFDGVPEDIKWFFRQWDDGRGLWGTAGLMAGLGPDAEREVKIVELEEVIREVIVRS